MTSQAARLRTLLCGCISTAIYSHGMAREFATALADSATDHLRLAALAGRHLVTPALAEAVIATPGLLARLPSSFAAYLELLSLANRRRNRALRRELGQAARHLNTVGIEPVVLKGAIRLVDRLYPHAGWRFLRDLDLLIPPDSMGDALAELQRAGYRLSRPASALPSGHRHMPGLVREGGIAPIELHFSPLRRRSRLCDTAGTIARARPAALRGARIRLPSTVDQLVHLIEHDRDDEELRQTGRFLLRSGLETALLCHDPAIVAEVLTRFADAGREAVAWVHSRQTVHAFPGVAPALSDALRNEPLATRALSAMAMTEYSESLQRLYWFGRQRISDLLLRPPARTLLLQRLATKDFFGLCLRRLREVWTDT